MLVFPDGSTTTRSEFDSTFADRPGVTPAGPGPNALPAGFQEAKTRVGAIKQAAQEKAQSIADLEQRAAQYGIKGKSPVDIFGQLEAEHADGAISDVVFAENVGLIKAGRHGQVLKFLKAKAEIGADLKSAQELQKAEVSTLKRAPAPTPASKIDPTKTVTVGRSGWSARCAVVRCA
jgi:hypothetical protein